MVRFSDMLSGNGEPERPRPISAADPAMSDEIPEPQAEPERDESEPGTDPGTDPDPGTDAEPGTDPEPACEADVTSARQSPEDVLDRLTQYATSARASDSEAPPEPAAPVPTSDASDGAPDELAAVGDDLLPHAKADSRKRRRK